MFDLISAVCVRLDLNTFNFSAVHDLLKMGEGEREDRSQFYKCAVMIRDSELNQHTLTLKLFLKTLTWCNWLMCTNLAMCSLSKVAFRSLSKVYFYFFRYSIFTSWVPSRWGNRRASDKDAGGRGFDPRQGHTKDFKNESNGCPHWRSGLRG